MLRGLVTITLALLTACWSPSAGRWPYRLKPQELECKVLGLPRDITRLDQLVATPAAVLSHGIDRQRRRVLYTTPTLEPAAQVTVILEAEERAVYPSQPPKPGWWTLTPISGGYRLRQRSDPNLPPPQIDIFGDEPEVLGGDATQLWLRTGSGSELSLQRIELDSLQCHTQPLQLPPGSSWVRGQWTAGAELVLAELSTPQHEPQLAWWPTLGQGTVPAQPLKVRMGSALAATWQVAWHGDTLHLAQIEGDSLVGDGSVEVTSFRRDTDQSLNQIGHSTVPLANVHLGAPMWSRGSGVLHLLVEAWKYQRGTLLDFELVGTRLQQRGVYSTLAPQESVRTVPGHQLGSQLVLTDQGPATSRTYKRCQLPW